MAASRSASLTADRHGELSHGGRGFSPGSACAAVARRGRAGLGAAQPRQFEVTATGAVGRSDHDPDRQRSRYRRDRRVSGGTKHTHSTAKATERGGLPVTATGNLSRAVVAEMCKLVEWPGYDQAAVFQFNKVINEP